MESLVGSNVHSLLCVPLTVFQKVIGCIYLDTTIPLAVSIDDHLQLVAAIAGISAVALENARRLQWLEQENLRLNTEINLEHNMVGESARMKEVYQFLSRVAPKESTVLIEGESGTGKELAARAIHRNSPRVGKAVCRHQLRRDSGRPAGKRTLRPRAGRIHRCASRKRKAVSKWPTAAWFFSMRSANWCRAAGQIAARPAGARVRAGGWHASHCGGHSPDRGHQQESGGSGQGRDVPLDLYYRLNVCPLVMPPLRDRREDIASPGELFRGQVQQKCNVKPKSNFSRRNGMPGELRLAGQRARTGECHRARAGAESLGRRSSRKICRNRFWKKNLRPAPEEAGIMLPSKEAKKHLILNAMHEARGNYTEAAHSSACIQITCIA